MLCNNFKPFFYLSLFQYIRDHFSKIDWHIEDDTFQSPTPYGIKTFTNIIVTQNPNAPRKLVLACHYDSKNISDSRGNFLIAATDSAVPCAILMDVAKKLDCAMRMERSSVIAHKYLLTCSGCTVTKDT